jgi:glutaryl-CoA dehydrogenase
MTATSPDTSSPPLYSNVGKALGTDYFLLKGQLSAEERDYLERTRRFVHEEVINGFWERAEVLPGGFRRWAGQVRARRAAR